MSVDGKWLLCQKHPRLPAGHWRPQIKPKEGSATASGKRTINYRPKVAGPFVFTPATWEKKEAEKGKKKELKGRNKERK
jgi:hypothetical protein